MIHPDNVSFGEAIPDQKRPYRVRDGDDSGCPGEKHDSQFTQSIATMPCKKEPARMKPGDDTASESFVGVMCVNDVDPAVPAEPV